MPKNNLLSVNLHYNSSTGNVIVFRRKAKKSLNSGLL